MIDILQLNNTLRKLFKSASFNRDTYKGVKKQNLPSKLCLSCSKPFTWRKKWEKNWSDVKYCSNRCRNERTKK